jgi:hypothetical protein
MNVVNRVRKDAHINARITQKERRLLDIMCQRENLGISEMLRACIRESAAKRGLYSVGLVEIISKYEVGGIANEKKDRFMQDS